MTAVDYLIEQLTAPCRGIPSHIIEKAKQMENEEQYKLKAFWFGRGILAAQENKIMQLMPKRNEKT